MSRAIDLAEKLLKGPCSSWGEHANDLQAASDLLRTQYARIEELEAEARQTLEALECISEHGHRCNRCDSEIDEGGALLASLRKTLGET